MRGFRIFATAVANLQNRSFDPVLPKCYNKVRTAVSEIQMTKIEKFSIYFLAMGLMTFQKAGAIELGGSSFSNLKVTEDVSGTSLHLTGSDRESAWPILKVSVKRKQNAIIVIVHSGFFGAKNAKSSLDETIQITSEINQLLFSSKKIVLWKRSEVPKNDAKTSLKDNGP